MSTPSHPQRLVLDTNVCLDLFVFRDPRWTGLLQAMRDGRAKFFLGVAGNFVRATPDSDVTESAMRRCRRPVQSANGFAGKQWP